MPVLPLVYVLLLKSYHAKRSETYVLCQRIGSDGEITPGDGCRHRQAATAICAKGTYGIFFPACSGSDFLLECAAPCLSEASIS